MKDQIQSSEDVSGLVAYEAENASLARRIVLKDADAMAELYNRHGAFAYSVLLAIIRDTSLAQELTQEVFLRLWHCIGRFDERRGDLKAWIGTIARNKAIDYMRSNEARARRRELGLDRLLGLPRKSSLEDQIWIKDLVLASRNRVQCLTEKQRETFRLAYIEGKTHGEIAAELNAPLGTVKTWVRTGLKRLRKELAGAQSSGKGITSS